MFTKLRRSPIYKFIMLLAAAYSFNVLLFLPAVELGPDVEHTADVLIRVAGIDPQAANLSRTREELKKNYGKLTYEKFIRSMNISNANEENPALLASFASLRKTLKELKAEKLEFDMHGFVEETEPYLQMIAFICISVLLTRYRSFGPWKMKFRLIGRVIPLALLYFIVSEVPPIISRYVFARTLGQGRASFAFYAADINGWAFAVCEIQVFVLCSMIIALNVIWLMEIKKCQKHVRELRLTGPNTPLNVELGKWIDKVFVLFNHWQWQSLVLAAAFLPWTYFDYEKLRVSGSDADSRYVYMAIVDHFTWIASWILLSWPLVTAFHEWKKCKTRRLLDAAPGDRDGLTQIIVELEPISSLQKLGAVIAGTASFILPFIAILRHG